ncbi:MULTISPECIES: FG-GAP repeat protein [Streptomyces]|uniref:FG-GAP repeat protein n=1 Tax=Streptomyces TaxID=1883 RepID=UPI000998BD45|nr:MULTISPECIES: FG-GAP repeat protein [Streptomyces]
MLTVGDFDHDGHQDLAVTTEGNGDGGTDAAALHLREVASRSGRDVRKILEEVCRGVCGL